MPIFKQGFAFEIVRNIRMFLNLEAGITRDGQPGPASRPATTPEAPKPVGAGAQKLVELRQQLEMKEQENAELRVKLATSDDGAGASGIKPENLVWIFGMARTGSSWLSAMMGDLEGHARWDEPYAGEVFGYAYYIRAWDWMRGRKEFLLGDPYKRVWLNSIRTFVLEGAIARFPEMAGEGYLVIKEPNGSIGAPLLAEALPESRMILLVRDPRDVVASILAANKKGSWTVEVGKGDVSSLVEADPDKFVRQRAHLYMQSLEKAKEAYEVHEGLKVMIRYEDLRHNTLKELENIYSGLEISVEEERLRRVVEKHAWENIPDAQKGANKPRRKATPGGWKEDLTPKQARIVEEITAPLLEEFYPG